MQTFKKLDNKQVQAYNQLTDKLSLKQYETLRRLAKSSMIIIRLQAIASGRVTKNQDLINQAWTILRETKQHLTLVEAA